MGCLQGVCPTIFAEKSQVSAFHDTQKRTGVRARKPTLFFISKPQEISVLLARSRCEHTPEIESLFILRARALDFS